MTSAAAFSSLFYILSRSGLGTDCMLYISNVYNIFVVLLANWSVISLTPPFSNISRTFYLASTCWSTGF
jgi:hypothetical protein